jgi:hypothetical protein
VLGTSVALHDIDDIEAFVGSTISRSGIQLGADEHDELLAEGIAILYQLAERFEPRRGSHQQDGRFSGFAAQFLSRKLGDAWHRLNPDHRYVTGEDGKRTWVYYRKPVSIQALEEGPAFAGGGVGGNHRQDGGWESEVRDPAAYAPDQPSFTRPSPGAPSSN